jgi:hypothetical protein
MVLVRASKESGVIGVQRPQVAFVPRNCVRRFQEAGTTEAALAGGELKNLLGRMPDISAAGENVSDIALPSGVVSTIDPRSLFGGMSIFDLVKPSMSREMLNRFPAGVARIDASQVIGEITARPYEVLPGVAGLDQLVREGAIEHKGWDTYYIKKAIRLPGDLDMAEFVVLKGVPEPTGTKGMVCVVSQETGALLPISKQRPRC